VSTNRRQEKKTASVEKEPKHPLETGRTAFTGVPGGDPGAIKWEPPVPAEKIESRRIKKGGMKGGRQEVSDKFTIETVQPPAGGDRGPRRLGRGENA